MPRPPCNSHSSSPPWWRKFFESPDSLTLGRFPDAVTSSREAEGAAGLLALQAGMTLADVPCGPGRHLPYWAELGCHTIGLDASDMMIRLARKAVLSAPGCVHVVQGLMEALPFRNQTFDVMVSLFNSFGYLDTDEANQRVLAEAARCLRPGGKYLLDTRNPPVEILLAPWGDEIILSDGRRLRAWASYSRETRRLAVRWVNTPDGRIVYEASIRLYPVHELEAMFDAVGMEVEAIYSDFFGSPFSSADAQVVLLARRR